MTKTYREWVCEIGPGCSYRVGIRIYSSEKELQKAFNEEAFSQEASNEGGEVEAFCSCNEVEENRISTLHFWRGAMSPDITAHEVFHAVMEMASKLHLNIEDMDAQELMAHSVSHLMENVKIAEKASRPPSKRRRRK